MAFPFPVASPTESFPLSNAHRRGALFPQLLWFTAPEWALNHLQGSSQLGLWALFCRYCRRGQAGNRELLKQQDLLQPTCRTLGDSTGPWHIWRNLPLEKQEATAHLQEFALEAARGHGTSEGFYPVPTEHASGEPCPWSLAY